MFYNQFSLYSNYYISQNKTGLY